MILRKLVMKFIKDRDHLGNEKYKKVSLNVRPELSDELLRETVDLYCGLTTNELVEATVVETRVLVNNSDLYEIEEIFYDEEQEEPTVENEEADKPKGAENSPDHEKIPDKAAIPEVEFTPDKEEESTIESSPDQLEEPEVKITPYKGGIPKASKQEKGWSSLWVPETVKYLDNQFVDNFLKKNKKRKSIKPCPLPILLSRDYLPLPLVNSNVKKEGFYYAN